MSLSKETLVKRYIERFIKKVNTDESVKDVMDKKYKGYSSILTVYDTQKPSETIARIGMIFQGDHVEIVNNPPEPRTYIDLSEDLLLDLGEHKIDPRDAIRHEECMIRGSHAATDALRWMNYLRRYFYLFSEE